MTIFSPSNSWLILKPLLMFTLDYAMYSNKIIDKFFSVYDEDDNESSTRIS